MTPFPNDLATLGIKSEPYCAGDLTEMAAMFWDKSAIAPKVMILNIREFLDMRPDIQGDERDELMSAHAQGCLMQVTSKGYEPVLYES